MAKLAMGKVKSKPPKRGRVKSVNLRTAGNGIVARKEYEYQGEDGAPTYGPDEESVHEGVSIDDVLGSLGKKIGSIDTDPTLDPTEKRRAKAKAFLK